MKYLVTGGCGFLGSNIASELIRKGHNVVVFDNLSRVGSYQNLEWLKSIGEFEFIYGDIRNTSDVEILIKNSCPNVIYHLAGQVAMTTSISNPRLDFEINVGGTFNLLNAVRLFVPECIVVYSSSNKVYGDLLQYNYREEEYRYICNDFIRGFNEQVNLDFHSPYGVSKGSADQYMLDFSRIYNLNTVVFRHSSMYGGRQFSTYDQGWVGWFCNIAVQIKRGSLKSPFEINGNGKQVRDLLFSSDCVALYLSVPENIALMRGQAFNIGGGYENSSSLLELFSFLEKKLDIKMSYFPLPPRESDQLVFIADYSKVNSITNWQPKVSKDEGVLRMLDWIESL